MSLCVHTKDGRIVTRDGLHNVPMPLATKTYQPVGHGEFMDMVEKQVNSLGLLFGKEEHGLSHLDMRHFGVVEIIDPTMKKNPEYSLMMAVRGSLDKRFPKEIGFGSHVFVCDNEAFIANNVMRRKHTPNIMNDLPDMILEAVSKLRDTRRRMDASYQAYRAMEMDDRTAHHTLVKCLREDAIITTKFEKAVQEWHEPSFDHGDKSAWRLFNAVTEASKGTRNHDLVDRTINLHKVMDEAVGFKYQLAA